MRCGRKYFGCAPGEIELAVAGANLSGMSLNPESTGHDARFLPAV